MSGRRLACARGRAYRLHGVVHRHEGLQALPLQHVGEFHVDGLHGPRVAHDPVLVGVGCVVVARCAGRKHTEVRPEGLGWPPSSPTLQLSARPAQSLQPSLKRLPVGVSGPWRVGGSAERYVSISL